MRNFCSKRILKIKFDYFNLNRISGEKHLNKFKFYIVFIKQQQAINGIRMTKKMEE